MKPGAAQRALLERHGFDVIIARPEQFSFRANKLTLDNWPVDMVYNRLVDFSLAEPAHKALRNAYTSGAVVLTPNPHNHAWRADKRNLTILSDPAQLQAMGAAASDVELLSALVPQTLLVTSRNAEALWSARRNLFFKPATGYGSKAAYRGSKITKGVWAQMMAAPYVAQEYAQPGERLVTIDGVNEQRKVDIRVYTYRGEILLTAARLYQGQTTNFRTPGGGFAPVLSISTDKDCAA